MEDKELRTSKNFREQQREIKVELCTKRKRQTSEKKDADKDTPQERKRERQRERERERNDSQVTWINAYEMI